MRTLTKTSESGPAKKPASAPAPQPVSRAAGEISFSAERCTASCLVHSVTALGCRIDFDPDDWMNPVASARSLPNAFKLTVPGLGFEAECMVLSRGKHQLGVRFVGRARALPPEFRKKRRFKGF